MLEYYYRQERGHIIPEKLVVDGEEFLYNGEVGMVDFSILSNQEVNGRIMTLYKNGTKEKDIVLKRLLKEKDKVVGFVFE